MRCATALSWSKRDIHTGRFVHFHALRTRRRVEVPADADAAEQPDDSSLAALTGPAPALADGLLGDVEHQLRMSTFVPAAVTSGGSNVIDIVSCDIMQSPPSRTCCSNSCAAVATRPAMHSRLATA